MGLESFPRQIEPDGNSLPPPEKKIPDPEPVVRKRRESLADPDDAWIIPAWIDPHEEESLVNPLEEWDE